MTCTLRLPLILTCLIAFLSSCTQLDPSHPEFVVASVNDVTMTRAELTALINREFADLGLDANNLEDDLRREYEYRLVNNWVKGQIIIQEIRHLGVKGIEDRFAERFQEVRESFGDEKAFRKHLHSRGQSEYYLREAIRREFYLTELLALRIPEQLSVSDAEAYEYYNSRPEMHNKRDRVLVRHILVTDRSDKGKAKIEAARQRILDGESFAKVAKEVSDDEATLDNGGALPTFSRDTYEERFEIFAFGTSTGEVSPVFETSLGLHIITVLERQSGRYVPFSEAKKSIVETLALKKRNDAAEELLQILSQQNNVQINIPKVKKGNSKKSY